MRALRRAMEAGAASITAAASAPTPVVGTQLNYTQNTQNIQNIHIHQAPVTVNYWGQEDVSWLTAPVVRALLEEALQRYGADGAAAAIWVYNEALRLTISNPERPKNLTAYIPNKKDGAPIVHRKTGWGLEPPSSCVYKPLSMRVFSQLFDNQPFDPDCDRYENIIFHLRDHEEWYHSDHSTKTLPSYLRTNKAYLAQHLGRLPQLGDPAIPSADAGEPLASAAAREPLAAAAAEPLPKQAVQFEPLSVAKRDEE